MRKPIGVQIIVFFSCALLSACFPGSIKKYQNLYQDKNTTISLSDHPQNKISFLYTGCGGLVINSDSFSVLIDPFYSNKGLSIIWNSLATDRKQVGKVCDMIDTGSNGLGKIRAVLIAHSHYDHMMDLPYLMNSRFKNQRLNIIGSRSVRNALSNISLPPYDFSEPAFPDTSVHQCVLPLNQQMNVSVIQSDHAPHVNLLGLKIKIMNKDIGSSGVKGFDTSGYKARFYRWREGDDYSFLVEVMKEHLQKPLRIFIQSSSCAPNAGIPFFLKDSVDIAFIGVASASNVSDYPGSLLKQIKPRYVVLTHWEDFFRAYSKKPKMVRATRFKVFLRRYKAVMGNDYTVRTSLPRQLTRYTFLY